MVKEMAAAVDMNMVVTCMLRDANGRVARAVTSA